MTADPLDPVEALRLSSALLALLPECKGATHSEAVSHCAECCFGSGYELHGPEDQVILDAAIALAALAALPAPVSEGVPEDRIVPDGWRVAWQGCCPDEGCVRNDVPRLVPLSDTPHEEGEQP